MSKQKFYAVKAGNKTGIFKDWPSCQDAIKGFSNAKYQSFISEEEAIAYLEGKDLYFEKIQRDIQEGYIVAYTDGSFDKVTQKYAYGIIIYDLNNKKHELNSAHNNPKFVSFENVSGEIFGVLTLLDWVVSNNYEKVKIYYDYEGIEKWATKEWRANSEIAKVYTSILDDKFFNILDIKFEHVKGHSNNIYNEAADRLAKLALTSDKKVVIKGENYYLINGYNETEVNTIIEKISVDLPEIKIFKDEDDIKKTCKIEWNHQKLCVSFFKKGKIMVQGKLNMLFQIFTTYLFESKENANVIKVLKDAYKKNINFTNVEQTYNNLFSQLPGDYPPSMEILLKQSIINSQEAVKSYDYSQYAFPAFRALEGHLKYLLRKVGIDIPSRHPFNMFNKHSNGQFMLTKPGNYNEIQKANIEKCYNTYNSQRSTLFHFGDLIGHTDNCRIISTYSEAKEYILDVLTIINETI